MRGCVQYLRRGHLTADRRGDVSEDVSGRVPLSGVLGDLLGEPGRSFDSDVARSQPSNGESDMSDQKCAILLGQDQRELPFHPVDDVGGQRLGLGRDLARAHQQIEAPRKGAYWLVALL